MTFLKKLFSRRAESTAAVDVAPEPAVLPALAASVPHTNGVEKEKVKTSAPLPGASREDWVSLRLKDITDLFNDEMKATLKKQPSEHVVIFFRKDFILPKLATGAVRISFAELRAATPDVFFHTDKMPADTKVVLPLQILLGQVKAPRRADQKQAVLPTNVPSIFTKESARTVDAARAKDGWYTPRKVNYEEPVSPALSMPAPVEERVLKMPETAAANAEAPVAEETALKIEEPVVELTPEVSVPEKAASAVDVEKAAAAYAAVFGAKAKPEPEAEPVFKIEPATEADSLVKAVIGDEAGPAEVEPMLKMVEAEPVAAAEMAAAAEQTVEAEPAANVEEKPEAVPAGADSNSFSLGFSVVRPALPEGIREALNGSVPEDAAFRIPMEEFESRMRTGKVIFKWGRLRDWCDPTLAGDGDADIELPLAGVVPIFMAARTKAPEARKRVEVDARIPEVFGKNEVKAEPAAAPAIAEPAIENTPAPVEPAVDAEVEQVEAPAAVEEAATELPKTSDAPASVVAELRKLEGIAGAFIATADGLLVAGDVPGSNANVLAAFAPTVFAQLTKYSGMAKLGLPETLDLQLDGGTKVHVRKTGKLYLGVLADRGTILPCDELARIAGAL